MSPLLSLRTFLPLALLSATSAFCAPSSTGEIPANTEQSQVVISAEDLPSCPEESSKLSGISGGVSGNALIKIGGLDEQNHPVQMALVLPLERDAQWLNFPYSESRAWAATTQYEDCLLYTSPSPRD